MQLTCWTIEKVLSVVVAQKVVPRANVYTVVQELHHLKRWDKIKPSPCPFGSELMYQDFTRIAVPRVRGRVSAPGTAAVVDTGFLARYLCPYYERWSLFWFLLSPTLGIIPSSPSRSLISFSRRGRSFSLGPRRLVAFKSDVDSNMS